MKATTTIDPGPEELARLYHDLELSYAGIADHLGCSRTYVMRLMKRHEIPVRSLVEAKQVGMKHGRVPGPEPREVTPELLEEQRRRAYERNKKHRKKHPRRTRARWRVQKARQRGSLTPEPCRDCGSRRTEAHHPDYSEPFEVIWLCKTHHMAEHAKMRAEGVTP